MIKKKAILYLVIAVFFFVVGMKLKSLILDSKVNGLLKIEKDFIDVGTITKGELLEIYVKFTNYGENELEITDVKSSCGCTVPKLDRYKLSKGRTDSLKVTYDTNILGYFNKEVLIVSNTPTSPARFWISGTVIE